MAQPALPQLGSDLFLTDGGIETTLIFLDGIDLPHFAAFDLLRTPEGTAALRRYFDGYADLATGCGTGLILESATWRASQDWADKLGYTPDALDEANRQAIRLLQDVRRQRRPAGSVTVVSGCLGPRGDGYVPGALMTPAEAEAYHRRQIEVLASAGADMIWAGTINYVEEAIGIARAARAVRAPVAISFTVETDGRLATGQALPDAIAQVDAATGGYPAYYMVNCAHPTHFAGQLDPGAAWTSRIRGIRANASRMSHAELNEAPALDAGDPIELGEQYAALRARLPQLTVLGGCCGTDLRHVEAIAKACG